jgi:hypothetical protein
MYKMAASFGHHQNVQGEIPNYQPSSSFFPPLSSAIDIIMKLHEKASTPTSSNPKPPSAPPYVRPEAKSINT